MLLLPGVGWVSPGLVPSDQEPPVLPQKISFSESGVNPRGCTTPCFAQPVPPCQPITSDLSSHQRSQPFLSTIFHSRFTRQSTKVLTPVSKIYMALIVPNCTTLLSHYSATCEHMQSRWDTKAILLSTYHLSTPDPVPRTQFPGLVPPVCPQVTTFENISLGPVA